jgi:lysophospholipid acyltransferase (LPLAT)-like uncharacterized protein
MTPQRKAEHIAFAGSALMRLMVATCRVQVTDRAGVLRTPPERPLLWAFWHNRLFIMPHLFERYFPGRLGAALASQSKDGEIIAAIIRHFGIRPIRGSSSRRGAAALVEMRRAINDGYIMAVTPDGPRGPRYHVHGGVIKLAQLTSGTIMPIHASYSRFWQLKSWDGFMIPKPFARIDITLDAVHHVSATSTEEEFEDQRLRFERVLQAQRGG